MIQASIIGCGYVGRAVATHWRDHLTVTATTTTPAKLRDLEAIAAQVVLLRGNDEAGLRSLLQNQDLVLLTIGARSADAYEETYLQTAKTLVQVLQDLPRVQQVIYTGSYAVYGDRQGTWVDETTPLAPANRNGEILAATEQILLSAASATRKICVFRLGGIYGQGRELVKIFGRAAGTTRPGTGADAANWVHLSDIVGAIDFARHHPLNGIYNLVGDVPITTGELLDRLFTAHKLPQVTWNPAESSTRPYNARVSNQKLRSAGYQFRYPEIQVTMPGNDVP
jgi:nucleoside-diphosphate-sugar epimerase